MKKRIIVCEDDKGVQELIQIMLENQGYDVKPLDNGETIQETVEKYHPDLILLDLWMPGINGDEVTKLLKNQKNTQHIPIIIVSAISEASTIARQAGAEDFLSKPFEMVDLLSKVKKYSKQK